ncbi:hypothetical protein F5I97DRAFT_1924821 [Phlebopus sp. FC_14]|nr:hypothetical protein F5I97DRAFT_1924821 [Phlebopus sp. FC_14]
MEGFQFIIESPQDTQSHKKRPRLVTSCDNCRLKKIKCLQPSPETQCEACRLAKIPCRFRDRERYFAERSRAIAGPSSTPYTRPDSRAGFPAQENATHVGGSGTDYSSGSSATYGTPQALSQSSHRSSYSPSAAGHGGEGHTTGAHGHRSTPSSSSSSTYGRQASQSSHYRSPQLFDPAQPQTPLRTWMPQFIQLFVNNFGNQCPFFVEDDLYDKWRRQALPPLLASCIAGLGARYSDIPEVVARGAQVVAETYCDNAKELLSASLHHPTIDTLHATILLAWAEYKSNRAHGFRQYTDLAMRTAMAIGLSEESSVQLSPYDAYQNRLRITWSSLTQLQLYASQLTA